MNVMTRERVVPIDAPPRHSPGLEEIPLTYGLLRQILANGGIIEEREAQKMDRAIHRLLHT
jgi:hypothetical protein